MKLIGPSLFMSVFILVSGMASAASCGETIVSNTTLTDNLDCNATDGLIVGAHNLLLDCGGYYIAGNRTSNSYGIQVSDYDNATIRNCIIRDYYRGILVQNSAGARLINNTISNSSNSGIYSSSATLAQILNNTINTSGVSIFVSNAVNFTIAYNTLTGGSIGMSASSLDNSTVLENTVQDHSGRGLSLSQCVNTVFERNLVLDNQYGFYLQGLNDDVSIFNNTINDNQYQGVILTSTSSNEPDVDTNITYNDFNQSQYNLRINEYSNDTIVHHNSFYRASGYHVRNNADSTQFNTTVSGAAQGNYYDEIGDHNISDSDLDGYGDSGSDYPYNGSLDLWTGSGADWGPIIPAEEGPTASVGVINLSDSEVEGGSIVYAYIPMTTDYNDSFTFQILANGVNRWNHTQNVTSAPTTIDSNISLNTSVLSAGSHTLNFTLYNSSDSFLDWNAELLTITASESGAIQVNKTVLNIGTIRIGDIVQYLINVTNTGQENITNITIIDNYDVDLNYTTASTTPTVIDYTNRIVNWTSISTNLENSESFNLYVNMSAIIYADRVGNIVNVTAVDSLGNTTQVSTTKDISILPLATSELIGLTIGWNLISIPLIV